MQQTEDKITLTLLKGSNTVVIKKSKNSNVFLLSDDSIIIGLDTLVLLIKSIVENEFISIETFRDTLK